MRPRSHSLSKGNKRTKSLFKVFHRDLAPRNSFWVTLLQAYFADPQAPPVCAWGFVQTLLLGHFDALSVRRPRKMEKKRRFFRVMPP